MKSRRATREFDRALAAGADAKTGKLQPAR
jgi:hypothetical protein